jgi:hypothetical protein
MAHNPPRPKGLSAAATRRVAEQIARSRPSKLVWRRTWEDQPRDFACADEHGNPVGRIYFNEHPNPMVQWFWSYFGSADGLKPARSGLCGTKDRAVRAIVEAHEA